MRIESSSKLKMTEHKNRTKRCERTYDFIISSTNHHWKFIQLLIPGNKVRVIQQ